jgi:proteasome lid subunit RPN8/RPN11
MKVHMSYEVKQRLDLYTQLAHGEISGLGRVIVDKGALYVTEIFLLEQDSTGATTDLKPDAVAEFLMERITKDEHPEQIKLWWHSHADMNVFWSGTDTETAGKFGNGWMLSLVVNKKGAYKGRLDVYDPVYLVVDAIELQVAYPELSPALKKLIEEEVQAKVTNRFQSSIGFQPGGGTYMGGGVYVNGVRQPDNFQTIPKDRTARSSEGYWEKGTDGNTRWIWYTPEERKAKEAAQEEEEEEGYSWRNRVGLS